MASVRTRKCAQSLTDSKLSSFVGQGKEFLHSEVPTLRAVIQRGILIKEDLLLEHGAAKTDIHVKQIVDQLVPLIFAQWQRSNVKFVPPVTIREDSVGKKVERLWGAVEEVVRGRSTKAKKEKLEEQLDKLLDVIACPHKIQLCNEPGSGCKDVKGCRPRAHISCDCPKEKKVPVIELEWLHAQRTKIGEKSSMMIALDDKKETKKQRRAEKRALVEMEAAEKKRVKQVEDERLLLQLRENIEVELEEEDVMVDDSDQEMVSAAPPLAKEQEDEARCLVDALLEERLGEYKHRLDDISKHFFQTETQISRWYISL